MICEKCLLEEKNEQVYFMKYLLDNSPDIELNRKHPAMIVCPGGGYLGTSDREAEPVAVYYLNRGFQVFVLRYNTEKTGDARYPRPLYDICKMMKIIHENSTEWNIAPDKIGIVGFSAGAHLCASLAVHWQDEFIKEHFHEEDSRIFRPDAVILGYPVTDYLYQTEVGEERLDRIKIDTVLGTTMYDFMRKVNIAIAGGDPSEKIMKELSPAYYVTSMTPPVFIWHTSEDEMVYVGNSLKFAHELEKKGVPFELHVFEKGPHGLALANHNSADSPETINEDAQKWTELADCFLKRHLRL